MLITSPYRSGPVDFELLTPTGAAILAALSPEFIDRENYIVLVPSTETGIGLGHHVFANVRNAIKLILNEEGIS